MMHELKAESGPVDLYSIPMPESLRHKLVVEKRDMVAISPIEDEYYGKLGNTEIGRASCRDSVYEAV